MKNNEKRETKRIGKSIIQIAEMCIQMMFYHIKVNSMLKATRSNEKEWVQKKNTQD